MAEQTLNAKSRTVVGRKVKQLRRQGQIPANIFGKNIKSQNISLDTKTFKKFKTGVGESTLFYIKVDTSKELLPVMIRDVVSHPVSGEMLHVSFNQVNLKEKVTAPVSINIVGEAIAEKEKLGIMVQQLDEIEIKALPAEMPEHVDVDVSSLSQPGDHIKVSDLKLSSKWEIGTDPQTTIVQIEALAKEEVEPVAAPATETEAVPAGEETQKTTAPEEKKEEDKKE